MTKSSKSKDWIDRDLYPFDSQFIKLKNGQMHYVDEGKGDVILFVHGTPTWSFLYREFIKQLSSKYRCIAIDHLGFGQSTTNKGFDGSPELHSENLQEFIIKMDLQDITIVVHDFGGPIGLGAAIRESERIKDVVLFNTWLWETKNNPDALKIDKLINSWVGRFLYLNLNFSPKVLLKKGFSNQKKLNRKVHRQYLMPFPHKESRKPLLNIAKGLVGSSDWYQNQWENIGVLEDKNWLILWGEKDQFINTEYLAKWTGRLEHANVKHLECGHFVQEELPDTAIEEIECFLNG